MMKFLRPIFIFSLIFFSGLIYSFAVYAQEKVTFSEFPLPTRNDDPQGITAGPDRNLWFTENTFSGNNIGRITPNGSITEFQLPFDKSNPQGITAGPDGNLWFTEQ